MSGPGHAADRFVLPVDGPYDVAHAIGILAAHSTPLAEQTDVAARRHGRLVDLGGGGARAGAGAGACAGAGVDADDPPRLVRLDVELDERAIAVEVRPADGVDLGPDDRDRLTAVVRRWLDLDADFEAVRAAIGDDPVLGPLVRARPGIRLTGSPDGFETAVTTVLGQQVSLAAARTFTGRLVAAYGTPVPGTGLTRFPRAEVVAAADAAELRAAIGVTGSRGLTVSALAAAAVDGLVVDPEGDHADIRRRLHAVRGIGPWTVEYLAIRALGDRDAWPSGDLVLRRVLGGVTAREAEAAGEAWAPHRAYALFQLWAGALVTA